MRERIASGDLTGASASASCPPPPTDPGTRLALGTRRGRPACVFSPAAGDAATSAARQPSSAADEVRNPCSAGGAAGARVVVAAVVVAPVGMVCPLRGEQADSRGAEDR